MNINKCKAKLISYIVCVAMLSGNFLTADAVENAAKDNYGQENTIKSSASNYSVIVPKSITLDESMYGEYSLTVTGDIPCSKRVYAAPVDGIGATEELDFYMKEQTSGTGKPDVAATITQDKVYWNYEEVSNAHRETGSISAGRLSAGTWKGTFEIAINLLDDPNHKHQYTESITKEPTCTEEGEKTYTCDCGDSYTEKIPATGHSYVDGKCEHCGEKDPHHEHQYTETVTKEPTCTEEGEKTYTCDCGDSYTEKIPATGHSYTETVTKEPTCTEQGEKTYTCENCGDSHTEKIPATGHSYVDGTCENCGESDPDHHDWKPLWFEVSELPSTKTADALTSSAGKTQSASNNLTIAVPEWYPTEIPYTYDYSYQYSGYTSGSVQCGSFSTSRSSSSSSSSGSSSGSREIMLKAGNNVIAVSARCSSNSTNGSGYRRWMIRGEFPSLNSCLDKTQHYCPHCQTYEKHYSACTDPAKDEYYFCEKCGLQFRHRCKFDEAQTAVAECTGGYADLVCVDDYYDMEHKLFDTCGQTSSIYFEGIGHDWKPYVVELNPTFETAANGADSSYKFVESSYGYTGTIGTAKNKSNGTTGILYIKLPDNFAGTYTLPISYKISSGSFTKTGYRMDVTCTNYYDYEDGAAITSGKSKSYLNYSLAYASTSAGTTSGTLNVELHPGNNAIRFGASASVNLNTWSTYTGSVTFKTPMMPYSVFSGKEVHKCSRCNIEESHADTFREAERVDANCVEEGYVVYVCDDCGFTYTDILPVNPDNHKNGDTDDDGYCDDCGRQVRHIHNYTRVVTTEPTCTTDGLAVYTCNGDSFLEDCTDNYSEILHAYGHDFKPDILSNCVGWHYMIYGSYWSQTEKDSGYTLKCTYNVSKASSQHSYSIVRIGITLPDDFEGTYTYRISYKAEGPSYGYASVLSEDVYLQENPWTETINAEGSSSGSFSMTCKAGTTYKYIGFANGYTNGSGINTTATLTLSLPKVSIDYSDQYHRCSRCGLKEEHHMSSGICNDCGYEDASAALFDTEYQDYSVEDGYTEESSGDSTEASTEESKEDDITEDGDNSETVPNEDGTAPQEENADLLEDETETSEEDAEVLMEKEETPSAENKVQPMKSSVSEGIPN